MLKLYNTLTKQKEEFVPLNPPNVNFYMCGPTVYDFFHVGNARSFLMSDVFRRYLEYKGYKVKFVMNLTDVDDKIIKKSKQENVISDKIAEKYINYFLEDVEKLGMKKADVYPRATQHMSEIIGMIKKLEDKGIAYNVNGNVFYDVSKFNGYGKLSGKKTDDLESGSRVEINEEKKNPLDFSLWKKAKEGEPYWESPWGKGRPGWHIECSAMSCKHLGDTFDIHGGGNDLIFPHHENEIAQSEGATGKPFVKYWMHFGFLNINEEKMSKSLGNFFTARDILKKYSPFAIHMFFTQAHYGGPLNFSDELLASAEKGLEKLNNLCTKINDELKSEKTDGVNPDFNFQKFEDKFIEVMDDDFNTPQGIAVLFDFAKEVNRLIAENNNLNSEFYRKAKDFLSKTAVNVFGILTFDEVQTSGDSMEKELIELLIQLRNDAKINKNYALSDNIRDGLSKLGITLQDSKDKTTYKKVKN